MNKICLIYQPAGIGDVFFLQKMVKHYISNGYRVIYPLLPQILFIKDYIKVENLEFYSVNDDFPRKEMINSGKLIETDEFVFIPAHSADSIYPEISCMEAKYKLINLDYLDWGYYFDFIRNYEKENELFYNVLKLKDNEEYSLVSNTWGTPPNIAKKEIQYDKSFKVINLELIDGYTVFDWSKVIENASHISIVDTSLNYIIEKLKLKSTKNYLTSRFTPANFFHILNLFKKDWIYLK